MRPAPMRQGLEEAYGGTISATALACMLAHYRVGTRTFHGVDGWYDDQPDERDPPSTVVSP